MSNVIFEKTAAMTPKAVTDPITLKIKIPSGTIYWGGAGLDGPYVQKQVDALITVGIKNVWIGLNNTATANKVMKGFPGTIVDAVRAGLFIRTEDDGAWTIERGMDRPSEQFNLIGYSYGSLLAAQTANHYAKQGHRVDHLVLIGSPIESDFLFRLRAYRNIKKVVVIDLQDKGDHIYAGMPWAELAAGVPQLASDMQAGKGHGHFYYGHVVADSQNRWSELAKRLHDAGLR